MTSEVAPQRRSPRSSLQWCSWWHRGSRSLRRFGTDRASSVRRPVESDSVGMQVGGRLRCYRSVVLTDQRHVTARDSADNAAWGTCSMRCDRGRTKGDHNLSVLRNPCISWPFFCNPPRLPVSSRCVARFSNWELVASSSPRVRLQAAGLRRNWAVCLERCTLCRGFTRIWPVGFQRRTRLLFVQRTDTGGWTSVNGNAGRILVARRNWWGPAPCG